MPMMFHVKLLPSLLYICLLFLLINDVVQGATAVPSNQPKPLRRVFSHLAWLKDAALDKVLGVAKTVQRAKSSSSGKPPSSSQLPATVLAKYGRDVILRFKLSTVAEEIALAEAADKLFLDIWDFSHHWMDLRLREDDVPSLLGILPESLQKAYSNLMPDLAKTIYDSYPSVDLEPESPSIRTERVFTPALRTADGVENAFFRDYQPFSVIFPWMRLMASMFKTHVRMISLGITYEGRDIPALRVGVSPGLPHEPQELRKTIVISGGLHAREWISVSTVTYIAWSLITSYGKIPDITKLLHEFDFVLIPTMNPDGYVYTWETDRLWKKNRQQTSLRFCRGLDLDHGFGFEWDSTMYQSSPCSESYPGSQPFQAVESHRLAAWAKNETENNGIKFVGFLDLHSYSQQVLYPYAYSCTHEPPSLENLEELGLGLAREIRRSSGKAYQVDSACESTIPSKTADAKTLRMEAGGGSAIDWFYHELRVRYSYQIKLRDTGIYGFLLPKEHIIPTGQEIFEAVKYFGNYLLSNKGVESITNEPKPSNILVGEKTEVDQVGKDPLELKWDLKRRGRR